MVPPRVSRQRNADGSPGEGGKPSSGNSTIKERSESTVLPAWPARREKEVDKNGGAGAKRKEEKHHGDTSFDLSSRSAMTRSMCTNILRMQAVIATFGFFFFSCTNRSKNALMTGFHFKADNADM